MTAFSLPPLAIIAGRRTPFATAFKELNAFSAVDLGVHALKATLAETTVSADQIDHVIMGSVSGQADAANLSRVIAIQAEMPHSVVAHTINRNCGSGMEAVIDAWHRIALGKAEVVIAGGTESMSQVPFYWHPEAKSWFLRLKRAKTISQKLSHMFQFKRQWMKPIPGLELGLTDPTCGLKMGQTAENLAKEFAISRESQDQYALQSHQRACSAQASPFFESEIAPLSDPRLKQESLDRDTGARCQQTEEALAKLKPYFDRKSGSITVGNSCPVTDGAVTLLVMTEQKAKQLGLTPLGILEDYSIAGLDPARMGLGPVYATHQLLEQRQSHLKDYDLIELNEAFAAQVLACKAAFESTEFCQKQLERSDAIGKLDLEKTNTNGGAIAIGHPVGATGARLLLTLLQNLKQQNKQHGLATLCIGGGQGIAMSVRANG